MNERDVTEAVTAWLGAECAIPATSQYPYPVASKMHGLPDVACIVERKRVTFSRDVADSFPQLQLQQHVWVRVFDVAWSIMVGVEDDADPDVAEQQALALFQSLQNYGAILEASAAKDDTLGSRVPMVSPQISFDYSPVFGETEDGTRGRVLVGALTIAEVIDEADF